jgi:hypothetical protein
MNMTKHATTRSQQRSITNDVLNVIQQFGRMDYAPGGAIKISLGKKEYATAVYEIKKFMKLLDRAKGGTMIIAGDNVVTVYKAS